MTSVAEAMAQVGGVARVATLRSAGLTASAIQLALSRGELRRIRKGWVATSDAPADLVRAVSLGGRLACISAARYHGLWTPERSEAVHVGRPAHAGRTFGDPTGTVEHWLSDTWKATSSAVESVPVLIRQVLLCCEREDAIAIIDSALNKRLLTPRKLAEIIGSLPSRFMSVLTQVDSASESGLETLCRLRLGKLGASIRSQVTIDGAGRVDLLIGDRLVVEADGRAWHDGAEAFHADRTRDLALHRLGYIVIRISYAHVMNEWMLVKLTIAAIIGRNEHLWSRTHRRAGLAN